MLDIYRTLAFDNVDGGVWRQGWEVKYDQKKVESEPKLQIFVIPHSHCDPGLLLIV
jgi:alpha-mannosidase II